MEFRQKTKKRIFINITSLIDVLFLLLIFFIVSSTFLEQPGMKLDLPETTTQQAVRIEGVTLVIMPDGSLFLNDEPVTMGNLETRLRESIPSLGEEGLVLRADESVRYGLVVEVMDLARRCGIEKLVVMTEPKEDDTPDR